MRQAITHQPHADVLEHQANARIRLFQLVERLTVHHSGVRVRQKPGALQHQLAHGCQIIECASEALPTQKLPCFRKNPLRLISQTKQRFFASGALAFLRHRQHFLRRHEMRAGLSRIFSKRAVRTIVAAKRGERNENFLRKADGLPFCLLAHLRSHFEQLGQRDALRQGQGFFPVHTPSVPRALQRRLYPSACSSLCHLKSAFPLAVQFHSCRGAITSCPSALKVASGAALQEKCIHASGFSRYCINDGIKKPWPQPWVLRLSGLLS